MAWPVEKPGLTSTTEWVVVQSRTRQVLGSAPLASIPAVNDDFGCADTPDSHAMGLVKKEEPGGDEEDEEEDEGRGLCSSSSASFRPVHALFTRATWALARA
jgi:hypothetical protein